MIERLSLVVRTVGRWLPFWLSLTVPLMAWGDDQAEARQLRGQGEIVPLESLVLTIREQMAGRILEVELNEKGGRLLYEIEILADDGQVRKFTFDARSGELLKTEQDN